VNARSVLEASPSQDPGARDHRASINSVGRHKEAGVWDVLAIQDSKQYVKEQA